MIRQVIGAVLIGLGALFLIGLVNVSCILSQLFLGIYGIGTCSGNFLLFGININLLIGIAFAAIGALLMISGRKHR